MCPVQSVTYVPVRSAPAAGEGNPHFLPSLLGLIRELMRVVGSRESNS